MSARSRPAGFGACGAVLGAALLFVGPAQADFENELVKARNAFADAIAEAVVASEAADAAEAELDKARRRLADEAKVEIDRLEAIEERRLRLVRELQTLFRRMAGLQLEQAKARDLSAEARRAYDQALPIYLAIGRTQRLADYPEWKAIESRARQTHAAMLKTMETLGPRIAAASREIDSKQAEILRVERAFATPLRGPSDPAMRQWLVAGIDAARARRTLTDAEDAMAKAFDSYAATMELARPPFLEMVTVDIGLRTVYRGEWKRDRKAEDPAGARIEELRVARDELFATINSREREREALRKERLEIAESMHADAQRYVDAEQRRSDARFNKILYAAVAEAAGTIVEVAFTGGVATAIRKSAELAEAKVAEVAARRWLRTSGTLTDETVDAAAILTEHARNAFARETRTAYAQAQRLAVEAAARRAQVTGEALDVATIDAKRLLDRALRGLANTDPIVRAEALLQARALLGDKAKALLEPIVSAAAGKTGGGFLAGLMHGAGASGDPIVRLSAPSADAAASNVAADVTSVVMGDIYEQGISRGLVFAATTAPAARREAARAMREAATANATRWRQIAAGSREFVSGGVTLKNFKETVGGSARGNLAALTTTGAKALVTAYFGAEEEYAGRRAYELFARMNVEQNIYNALRAADAALEKDQNEDRRLHAALRTYIALLGSPRELEIHDDNGDTDAQADLKLRLRFSTPIDRAPRATLAGVELSLEPIGAGAEGSAIWSATVARARIPADIVSAQLEVSLAPDTAPFARLDANPATPARPDVRLAAIRASGRLTLDWIDLDGGSDRHHRIALRDPWSGVWARGDTLIRVTRGDQDLRGVIDKPSATAASERGFAVGDLVLRANVGPGRTVQFEMQARYDKKWREKCAGRAEAYWSRGDYTLDPEGILTGEWEDRQLDESCAVVESVRRTDVLRRVGPN